MPGFYAIRTSPEGPGPNSTARPLWEEKLLKAADALKAKGVAFTGEPHRIHTHPDGTEEWMAFFADPEGNPVAMMSSVKP